MSVATVITQGYGSFAGTQFIPTLGYAQAGVRITTVDTHDGFDEDDEKKVAKERLHNQIEVAFQRVFEKPVRPPVMQPLQVDFRPEPYNDDDEWLLLI